MSKPRPPEVNEEKLSDFIAHADEIDGLKARLLQLEKLRLEEELLPAYIAFEALCSLLGGRIKGFSDGDLRRAWPESWGDSTVMVPAALLKALAEPWIEYKDASSGVTLGEAFGVEGGGQGRAKMKDTQAIRDRDLRLANKVAILYVAAGVAGKNGNDAQPISLDDAYAQVAELNDCSAETVKKAYAKYNPKTRNRLKGRGILKG